MHGPPWHGQQGLAHQPGALHLRVRGQQRTQHLLADGTQRGRQRLLQVRRSVAQLAPGLHFQRIALLLTRLPAGQLAHHRHGHGMRTRGLHALRPRFSQRHGLRTRLFGCFAQTGTAQRPVDPVRPGGRPGRGWCPVIHGFQRCQLGFRGTRITRRIGHGPMAGLLQQVRLVRDQRHARLQSAPFIEQQLPDMRRHPGRPPAVMRGVGPELLQQRPQNRPLGGGFHLNGRALGQCIVGALREGFQLNDGQRMAGVRVMRVLRHSHLEDGLHAASRVNRLQQLTPLQPFLGRQALAPRTQRLHARQHDTSHGMATLPGIALAFAPAGIQRVDQGIELGAQQLSRR